MFLILIFAAFFGSVTSDARADDDGPPWEIAMTIPKQIKEPIAVEPTIQTGKRLSIKLQISDVKNSAYPTWSMYREQFKNPRVKIAILDETGKKISENWVGANTLDLRSLVKKLGKQFKLQITDLNYDYNPSTCLNALAKQIKETKQLIAKSHHKGTQGRHQIEFLETNGPAMCQAPVTGEGVLMDVQLTITTNEPPKQKHAFNDGAFDDDAEGAKQIGTPAGEKRQNFEAPSIQITV